MFVRRGGSENALLFARSAQLDAIVAVAGRVGIGSSLV